jgi:DNA invertase Pin-like site-specific DNA recombinase
VTAGGSQLLCPATAPVGGFWNDAAHRDLLGYARISTTGQDPALQHDALGAAGCIRIWTDIGSGASAERPELANAMDHLRAGDTLVVWRLDRLGRSLPHLIETVAALDDRAVAFRSLCQAMDTSTAGGRLIFHVFGALVSFERELLQERTIAGLEAARARGRNGGRPTVVTPAKLDAARRMRDDKVPIAEILEVVGIGRSTLYRHL